MKAAPLKNLNGEPLGWDRSTYDHATKTWKHEYVIVTPPHKAEELSEATS